MVGEHGISKSPHSVSPATGRDSFLSDGAKPSLINYKPRMNHFRRTEGLEKVCFAYLRALRGNGILNVCGFMTATHYLSCQIDRLFNSVTPFFFLIAFRSICIKRKNYTILGKMCKIRFVLCLYFMFMHYFSTYTVTVTYLV